MPSVDQHRAQGKCVGQRAPREIIEVGCLSENGFRRVRQGKSIAGAGACRKRDLARATATDMAIDAMFFRNRLETLSRADRLGGSEE